MHPHKPLGRNMNGGTLGDGWPTVLHPYSFILVLMCHLLLLFPSVPCVCSLDDFRQPSNPESHRNPLTPVVTSDPTPTIAKVSRTPAHHIYVGVIVGFSVGVGVLILVWVVVWVGRKRRKNTSPRIFRKSNSSKIDLGYLAERVGLNSNVGNMYSANSGELGSVGGIVNSRSENGILDGAAATTIDSSAIRNEDGIFNSGLGSGSSGNSGVVLLCDDPRLPLVPSRSWSELKMNGCGNANKNGATLNGKLCAKPVMASRSSTNSLCTRNSAGNLVIGCRGNNDVGVGNTITLARRNNINGISNQGEINLCNRPSSSSMNIARNHHNQVAINNSKSISSIVTFNSNTNNLTPLSSINKSSGNIASTGGTLMPYNNNTNSNNNNAANRYSSSTMSTKSTDSSNLSSNDTPGAGSYFIKPPVNFSTSGYAAEENEQTIYSSPAANFPTQPAKFTASSSSSSGGVGGCGSFNDSHSNSPFPEYSSPIIFEDINSTAIYTTPTPTTSASSTNHHRPLPPNLPPRFHPPPPPSTPPPSATNRQSQPQVITQQRKLNFM